MLEVVNDPQSDPATEAPDPSRAVTRPYVFDPGTVESEWAAWRATRSPQAPLDEAEEKRIVDLRKAMVAVSLPPVKP